MIWNSDLSIQILTSVSRFWILRSLKEVVVDKIRAYHTDYNNLPSHGISIMPAFASTSGRVHSEFVWFLILQAHRETDRFFTVSGVQFPQPTSGLFHFHHSVFSSQVKVEVGIILFKVATLLINLNIDGVPIGSKSHTPPSHSQTTRLRTSSLSLGVPVSHTPQCMWVV
jgi:hypothetical protein